ncbi:MAG TPA: GxxExxY protein [Tepidisphaeraceae bacterium]|jgi:GxxExxY protein
MDADERRFKEISGQIIGAAMAVSNELGVGFLEKVYERALLAELAFRNVGARGQVPLDVHYKGILVGQYVADLVVEGSVLVEIKHASGLDNAHLAQCLNYLKATGHKLCILINFGKSTIEYKRVVREF